MTNKTLVACSMGICLITASSGAAASRQAVNTLVYDYSDRTLCWLEKTVKDKSLSKEDVEKVLSGALKCPDNQRWSRSDYFRTGDVVRLLIVNYRMLSRFTVEVNGTVVAPDVPEPRGMAAPEAATPAPKAPTGTDVVSKVSNTADTNALYLTARTALTAAKQKLALVRGIAGAGSAGPGSTAASMRTFTDALKSDTSAAVPKSPPYIDTAGFVAFLDRADALLAAVPGLNARIKDALEAANAGRTAAALFIGSNDPSAARKDEITKSVDAVQADESALGDEIGQLNLAMVAAIDTINGLQRMSRERKPFELTLGQFSDGRIVSFAVSEAKGFVPYTFAPVDATPPAPKAPSPAPGTAAAAALAKAAKADAANSANNADTAATPKDVPKPSPIFESSFDVHPVFRANVVSGFIASSLRNREYGIQQVQATDQTGKPAFKDTLPIYNKVPFEGEAKRPQYHYYVGVDLYFWEEDFFPGSRPAVIPSLLIGYGIDEPFNFFVGPNFETKIGLNIGIGWHAGRETFLAPGLVAGPGGTVLAADATQPATVKRFASDRLTDSWYVNVGFDYRTFKNVFGGIVGLK